jgi:hypothetical protein
MVPLFKQIAKCLNSSHFQVKYGLKSDHTSTLLLLQLCYAPMPLSFCCYLQCLLHLHLSDWMSVLASTNISPQAAVVM